MKPRSLFVQALIIALVGALPLVAVARDRTLVALTLALCAYQLSVAVEGLADGSRLIP